MNLTGGGPPVEPGQMPSSDQLITDDTQIVLA